MYTALAIVVMVVVAGSGYGDIIPDPDVYVKKGCGKDWIHFQDKCYYFARCNGCSPGSLKPVCAGMGGIQAKITSAEIHQFIVKNKKGGKVSIGAYDSGRKGTWCWEDGSPVVYAKWHPGEPNRVGKEQCMMMGWEEYHDNDWIDIDCKYEVEGYVCEKCDGENEKK